DRVELNAPRQ
nr:Chain C, Pepd [Pseudomonas aeruginosa]